MSRVAFPTAGIDASRHPDGAVVLYHWGGEIRLGAPEHAPAQAGRWPPR
ncbi:hypothetical protein [Nonomuraea sp. NPDC049400]